MQPLYKGQLQRLLLNLCANSESRTALVKILMDLLMLDIWKPVNNLSASEPSYRLYACQSHVMYSRPQSFDGDTSIPLSYLVICWLGVIFYVSFLKSEFYLRPGYYYNV